LYYPVPDFRMLTVGWRRCSWKQMITMQCAVCYTRGDMGPWVLKGGTSTQTYREDFLEELIPELKLRR
jgi:hypothetical protein